MNIREYTPYDFEEVYRWAKHDPGTELTPEQFGPTTFIAENSDGPIAVIGVLLTNSKQYAIPEGLYLNPDMPIRVRKQAIDALSIYVEAFAKALEYRGLFCIPINKRMARHFKRMGFDPLLDLVSTMYKKLGG